MSDNDNVRRCQCCGQPLLPPPVKMRLSPQQRRIYEAVRQFPRTTEQLHELLYGADPNGGPLAGTKTIHVVVSQINRRLRPYGVKLRNPHQSHYHLVEVDVANPVCEPSRDTHA